MGVKLYKISEPPNKLTKKNKFDKKFGDMKTVSLFYIQQRNYAV